MSERTGQHAGAIPKHIAIIMDGNGRWAKNQGLSRTAGHRAGARSVRAVIEGCIQSGVQTLTLFAFSSENWKRPQSEVRLLLGLFLSTLHGEFREMKEQGIRFRVVGDITPLPKRLQKRIAYVQEVTANNQRLHLNVAMNYGGRWDITQAAISLAERVRAGTLEPSQITAENFAHSLVLADVGDPDLCIRSGGERRLSNFLLWQCAYSELYFTPVLWPDFGAEELRLALADYAVRQRRFGMTEEQILN